MTESELAKTYGVSLITVRKAMGSLMEKGLVVREAGKRTFVTKPKFSRNMKKLQSFSEMCVQMGVTPGGEDAGKPSGEGRRQDGPVPGRGSGKRCDLHIPPPVCRSGAGPDREEFFPVKIRFFCWRRSLTTIPSLIFSGKKRECGWPARKRSLNCAAPLRMKRIFWESKKGDYLLFVRSTAFDDHGDPLYAGTQIINGDRFFSVCVREHRKTERKNQVNTGDSKGCPSEKAGGLFLVFLSEETMPIRRPGKCD